MDPKSSAKQLMGYSFLVVFANDDTIDEKELAMLERIALRDDKIDDDERRVLKKIFARVTKEQVTDKVCKEIDSFRSKYDI